MISFSMKRRRLDARRKADRSNEDKCKLIQTMYNGIAVIDILRRRAKIINERVEFGIFLSILFILSLCLLVYLHAIQLLLGILLRFIADIGVLQSCFVSTSDWRLVRLNDMGGSCYHCLDSFLLGSLGRHAEQHLSNRRRECRESVV